MSDQYFIGLMSGTSMDGVDAVLVDFTSSKPQVIATHEAAIPATLLQKLHLLADPKTPDINLLGECDRACGKLFAQCVNDLLKDSTLESSVITAIGSHGQTIRHMPNAHLPFSIQIGDPATIAVNTTIDTIADFRRKDIALGGQGAPLVPAFHQAIFGSDTERRVILNIGGIANITWLDGCNNSTLGFDTGPGNTLLDLWYKQHHTAGFDNNGDWARSGKVNQELLSSLLKHPYFSLSAPKSTGRELFNLSWLNQHLKHFNTLSPQDIQATLSQFTAQSICDALSQLGDEFELYICGGGIFNLDLIDRVQALLPTTTIASTAALGVEPQWVEAIAFAWLAYCFVNRHPSNLPAVTGAKTTAILGAFYPAK